MNLITNAEFAKADLADIIRLFPAAQNADISVNLSENKRQISVEILIGENLYQYVYPPLISLNAIEKKRQLKRFLKLSLYKTLSEIYNVSLPWGSLTGIRPVKLARQLAAEGRDFEKAFTGFFSVSPEKTALVKDVLSMQEEVLQNFSGTDLFINIPFCPSRCYYCSFISAQTDKASALIEPYTAALTDEIAHVKAKICKNPASVYIGGGTPVCIGANNLRKVLEAADISGVEFTVEAGRPDCIDAEILRLLKDFNVNRICVNPQTFCDKTLARIGRRHTGAQVTEKFLLAKEYGFDINMDLIAGLDGETLQVFIDSVDKAIALKPDNITVHTLSVKRGSILSESTQTLSENGVEQMLNYAQNALRLAGYKPYYMYRQKYTAGNFENTGYSLKGKQCLYNIKIMEELSSVVACGANAISKRIFDGGQRIKRLKNAKDINTYIEKLNASKAAKDSFFG